MNCPKCGYNRVPEGALFCVNCGEEILEASEPSTQVTVTQEVGSVMHAGSKIIEYRKLIAKSVEGFVGRQWVRDAVNDFLKAEGPRYFLLLGEPGSGKTAFMADLVQRHGYPHHFIGKGSQTGVQASLDWRDPVKFAESIGYQLVRDYGGWIMDWERWGIKVNLKIKDLRGLLIGGAVKTFEAMPRPGDRPALSVELEIDRFGQAAGLIGVYIDTFKMDVERIISQLLIEPLTAIARRWPKHQVVIIVDGLDEAMDYSSPENIFKVLSNVALPANVRFLLSSQPGTHLTYEFLSQARSCWLSEDKTGKRHPGVMEDAKGYVRTLAREEKVRAMLARHNIEIDRFIQQVAEASQGNFLYLHHYARGVREVDEALLKLEALPKGLYGIYGDFLSKIAAARDDVGWDTAYKPVLGTLAVAQEPLTRGQIADLSGVKPSTVGTILTQLKQFLDLSGKLEDRRYAIFHASFGDYLVSEYNQDYIDRQEAHARIANFYLKNFADKWSDCDGYGLGFVVYHVIKAQFNLAQLEDALEMIFTLPFMAVRAEHAGWHMPFVRDLQMVGENSPAQVVAPCLQILLGSHRNSLVNQEVLRLLKALYPELQAREEWAIRACRTYEVIRSAVAVLNRPAGEAVPRLEALLARTTDVQVKGVIALALGETKSRDAIPILRQNLIKVRPREDHVSWCAADALIALNTPNIIDPSLITTLQQDFNDSSIKHGIKQRILYVLGRIGVQLSFEEAHKLTARGLKLHGNSKVRAIDLIWLLLPKKECDKQKWVEEFEPFLWEALGFNPEGVKYDQRPKWDDEWVQKRLVTALGRVGSSEAKKHLERFATEVENRSKPTKKSLKRKRAGLKKSIQRAIYDLQGRHL